MSGTAIAYTAAAAARLDDYLRQVRAAVAGSPELDADDIEADIREHVAVEFQSHTRPVALAELEAVLAALGPPAGWAPAPPRPTLVAWVRRHLAVAGAALWRGPEDWRLAYLCLLLFLLAPLTAGLSLAAAYLLGRAAVALAAESGRPLGARRWLVLPGVAVVPLVALPAVLLWPLLVAGAFHWHVALPAEWYRANVAEAGPDGTLTLRAEPHQHAGPEVGLNRDPDGHYWMDPAYRHQHELAARALDRLPGPAVAKPLALAGFAGLGMLLLWGLVVGLVGWQFPRMVAAVFFPLLPADGRGAARLAVGCGAGFVVWVGFACRLVDAGSRWA